MCPPWDRRVAPRPPSVSGYRFAVYPNLNGFLPAVVHILYTIFILSVCQEPMKAFSTTHCAAISGLIPAITMPSMLGLVLQR